MIIANEDTLISKGFNLDNISNELDTLIKEVVFPWLMVQIVWI